MEAVRRLYRWLVRRLPPRAAWMVWRAGGMATSGRRRGVAGPEVAVAEVAWGTSEEEFGALIDRLTAASRVPASHLLVISDCDAVQVAATRGCRVEYVPARDDWVRAFPADDYEAFLSARGRAIAAAYRIGRVEVPGNVPEILRRSLQEGPGGTVAGTSAHSSP